MEVPGQFLVLQSPAGKDVEPVIYKWPLTDELVETIRLLLQLDLLLWQNF